MICLNRVREYNFFPLFLLKWKRGNMIYIPFPLSLRKIIQTLREVRSLITLHLWCKERTAHAQSKTAKRIQEFDDVSLLGCFSDRFMTRRFSVSVEEEDRETSSRDKVQGRRSDCPRDARSIYKREINGRCLGDNWGNGKCEIKSKCIAIYPKAIIRSHVSNRKGRTIDAVYFFLSNEWESGI